MLRIYLSTDVNLHDWDERYHALVAKHLLLHPFRPTLYEHSILPYDYRNWTGSHIWLHKQPFPLWLMALSIDIFGLHAFAVRVPAILLTTFAIWFVYSIGKMWYGREVGFLAAILASIHGLIIELAAGRASTDCVDAVCYSCVTFAVWLSIKAVQRRSLILHVLLGATIGLGILTKWLPALITLPIWAVQAYPVFRSQWGKLLVCAACVLVSIVLIALPWQLYIFYAFPIEARWEWIYNNRHFFHALEGHEGNFFYHFDHLRMKYGEFIYLAIIWATWEGLRRRS